MKAIKDYVLDKYLPTSSKGEKQLFWETNDLFREVVQIACEYSKEMIDEILATEIKYTLSSGAVVSAVRSVYINDIKDKIK